MLQKNTNRIVALSTLGAITFTSFGALTVPAQASVKGRRNTTIALGAVTAYGLLKHKRGIAIAGGVGTAIAYSRYRKAKKRHRRHTRLWYQNRYGRNWRNHYPS